ncbi:MAG: translation elongation factor Ts [Cytophagales bacterium]|nr:translation elongation factor Ts [Cytophagales bacterium]
MSITAKEVQTLRQETGAGMMDCKKALAKSGGDIQKAIEILRKRGEKLYKLRSGRENTEGVVCATLSSDSPEEAVLLSLTSETDFVARNEEFRQTAQQILRIAAEEKPRDTESLKALKLPEGILVEEKISHLVAKVGEKIDIGAYKRLHAPGGRVVPYIHAGDKLGVLVALSERGDEKIEELGLDIAMQVAAMEPIAISEDKVDPKVVEKELEIGKERARQEGKPENILDKIAQGRVKKFFKDKVLLQQVFVKDNSLSVAEHIKKVGGNIRILDFLRLSI